MRAQREIACSKSRGHCAGVGAEVRTIRTTTMAKIARLALPPAFHWLGKVGCSANDYFFIKKLLFYFLFENFLNTIHFKRWKKISVRKLRKTIAISAHANKRLHVIIP